jgi:hypothetical protein
LTTAGIHFADNTSWNSLPRSSVIRFICLMYPVRSTFSFRSTFIRLPVACELPSSRCLSLLEVQ